MTGDSDKALLPAGLEDILPPEAAQEAHAVEHLIASFAAQGYERVKPPLLEFEETLLAGAGAGVAQQTFRLMDPISQRMMGLRADMTPQVARIAAARLGRAPRPLRLCYGGQVLRVRGSQLRSERQFGQVGAELIGAPQAEADAELVLLATEALANLGLEGLSVDVGLPPLVTTLAEALGIERRAVEALRAVLDRKDAAAIRALAGEHAPLFQALLESAGPAEQALSILLGLHLPDILKTEIDRLVQVVGLVRDASPGLTVTVDPVEHLGFEYQTGVSFTLFASGVRGELGRGGRYLAERPDGTRETAIGFTLYMDSVMRGLPAAAPRERLYLPFGTPVTKARALRAEGWTTLAGLAPSTASGEGAESETRAEAARLGCSHIWSGTAIEEL